MTRQIGKKKLRNKTSIIPRVLISRPGQTMPLHISLKSLVYSRFDHSKIYYPPSQLFPISHANIDLVQFAPG